MSEPKALRIASAVRSVAEQINRRSRNTRLRFQCAIVSRAFSGLLSEEGIDHCVIGGTFTFTQYSGKVTFGDSQAIKFSRSEYDIRENHAWVEIGDEIWDLTLTQFDKDAPSVAVLKKPDERYQDGSAISRDSVDLWLTANCIDSDSRRIMQQARAAIRRATEVQG